MKQGEIDYLRNLGEEGAQGAFDKPFSHLSCAKNLIDLGMIMALLPQPPARLLDLGCGTGWTSAFLARRGYRVTGQDIAPDMIEWARRNKERYRTDALDFIVSDFESLPFENEFDCAVFYDSLHHATDARLALTSAWRALRLGGVLVTHEPGAGHSTGPEAIEARERFGVTENDMPPALIRDLGRAIGFTRFEFLLDPTLAVLATYGINLATLQRVRHPWWRNALRVTRVLKGDGLQRGGICLLTK